MSNPKRKLAGSDSDPYSSSPPSVEGNSVWPARGKELEKQMEEQQNKMKELENQMEEQGLEMKKLKKGMKKLENENKELKCQMEEKDKEVRKLKKGMKELQSSKPSTSNNNWSSSGNPSVREENTKNWKLCIEMNVAKPVYTSNNLVGDPGNRIQISLIDSENGQIITTGIESSVKVHFVVLDGNFNREDHENWPPEEFDRCIVKGRKHKAQPLIGDLEVTLKQGVGFVDNLRFLDNSSWISDGKFRIGVRVASGYCEGTRIREAFTEPFTVLDNRGKLNKKHHPPNSSDDVWRLEGIGKDGQFHVRLKAAGINNVEKFLQAYNKDPEALKSILGRTMTATNWNSLIKHAQTCPTNGKWLVYYGYASNYAPLFNNFARLTGFIWNGVPRATNSISDGEKAAADELVKLAHQNWEEVTEYEAIIPLHDAEAVPPGNHDRIPVGSSISQDHPTEISHQDHPESSAFRSQGFSSQHNAMTNSGMAAEHASTSQQDVPAVETSTDPQLVPGKSPQFNDDDGIYTDEFLQSLGNLEKHPDI